MRSPVVQHFPSNRAALLCVACLALLVACSDDDRPSTPRPPERLDRPTLSLVERSPHRLVLEWRRPARSMLLSLERRAGTDSSFTLLSEWMADDSTRGSYPDSGLASHSTYAYRVRASNEQATSDWSDTLEARTGLETPTVTEASAIDREHVRVRWTYPCATCEVEIARRTSAEDWSSFAILPAERGEAIVTTSRPALVLRLRLRAIEGADTSGWSLPAEAPLDQYTPGPIGTVERLQDTYLESREALLASCLAPDFLFQFGDQDVVNHPTWGREWSHAHEEAFTSALLHDAKRSDLAFDLDWDQPEAVTPEDQIAGATMKIKLHVFRLLVVTRDDEDLTRHFEVLGGEATLFVRERGAWPHGGSRWEIVVWRDERGPTQPVGADTWGMIRQFYLPYGTAASGPLLSLPEARSTLILPQDGTGCGTLFLSTDGSYESGVAWGGVARALPNYGAFAEPYTRSNAALCSVTLDLARSGSTLPSDPVDVFVWADDDGTPGTVLGASIEAPVGAVTAWPMVSRVVVPLSGVCVDGSFWVGFVGTWDSSSNALYIAVDTQMKPSGGMTNVPPGTGFPEGWQPIDTVYPSARSLGIGCEDAGCGVIHGR